MMVKGKSLFKFIALGFIVFGACNKDDEIIIDNPVGEEPGFDYRVIEYLPAPGQFINEKVSGFDNISDMEEACARAEARIRENLYVSLGAWGGYLVIQTGSPIKNTGGYEFSIAGNAFDTSNEPGIVWVMQDKNSNGKADDEWFELKGSYYGMEGYERNYSVTYFRPEGKGEDTRWEDSNGEKGTINWAGVFHPQEYYYPAWIKEDSYTLHGTRLPSNSVQNEETGEWKNPPFKWGYADNMGEDAVITQIGGKTVQKNFFRISDAIDKDGNAIDLKQIDFIKVQTGINGKAGIIGENSTEICGFFIED